MSDYDLRTNAERDLRSFNGNLDRSARFAARYILLRRKSIEIPERDEDELLDALSSACPHLVTTLPLISERERNTVQGALDDVRYAFSRQLRMWVWEGGRSEYDWLRLGFGRERDFAWSEVRWPLLQAALITLGSLAMLGVGWTKSDHAFAAILAAVVILNRLRVMRRESLLVVRETFASLATAVFALHRRLDDSSPAAESDEFHSDFVRDRSIETAVACHYEDMRNPRILWFGLPGEMSRPLIGLPYEWTAAEHGHSHWASKLLDQQLQ